VFTTGLPSSHQTFTLAALLLQPALIIIDHGHFQYNCISLGLTAAAAAAIGSGHQILGSILFSLSLNHKQMGLFYAPAFFAHLFGWCLQHRSLSGKVWTTGEVYGLASAGEHSHELHGDHASCQDFTLLVWVIGI
jgi:alpha-1,3-glucosyltransferase